MDKDSASKSYIDMSIAELIDVLENREADITYNLRFDDSRDKNTLSARLMQGRESAASVDDVRYSSNYPQNGFYSLLFTPDPRIISMADYNKILMGVLDRVHTDENEGNTVKIIGFNSLRADNCRMYRGTRSDVKGNFIPNEINYHTAIDSFDSMRKLYLNLKLNKEFNSNFD